MNALDIQNYQIPASFFYLVTCEWWKIMEKHLKYQFIVYSGGVLSAFVFCMLWVYDNKMWKLCRKSLFLSTHIIWLISRRDDVQDQWMFVLFHAWVTTACNCGDAIWHDLTQPTDLFVNHPFWIQWWVPSPLAFHANFAHPPHINTSERIPCCIPEISFLSIQARNH